jgi:O-antigen/teichoic acid export membrane protein
LSSLKHKSYNAIIWDMFGRYGNQAISFVISMVLARLLEPSDFGQLALVNVLIVFSGVLLDMGLGISLIQKQDVKEVHYGTVFWFNLFVGVILAILLFCASGLIASFYNDEKLKHLSMAMSLVFVNNAFGNVIRVRLRKELNYAIPVKANLFSAIIGGATGVIMAYWGYGVWSLVIQSILSGIIANIILFLLTRWKPNFKFQWQALKELWGFGFKMFIAGIMDTFFTQLDSIIIGKLFSPLSLGFYNRGKTLNTFIIQNASISFTSIIFPVITQIQQDKEKLTNLIDKSFHLITFISFFLCGLFYVGGRDIIVILFSEKWLDAVPFFKLIMLTGYVYPVSAILVSLITGRGNSGKNLKLEIIKKSMYGMVYIIGFHFGIEGFLIGNAIVGFFAIIANMFFAKSEISVSFFWFLNRFIPYLLVTLVIVLGIETIGYRPSNLNLINLTITGLSFASLYMGACYLLKIKGFTIAIEEITGLYKRKFSKK